jgi:hexokinase
MSLLAQALNQITKNLTLSTAQLRKLSARFQTEMNQGLAGATSSLKMLQTFVQQPHGGEQARVIVVDWGGTHGRVVAVELKGHGTYAVLTQEALAFTPAQKTGAASAVFDLITITIARIMGEDRSTPYSLGFIYSFPARVERINKAIALSMTKGWHLDGLQGQDVVALLTAALRRQGLRNVTVSAIANDTVAPMVLHTYRVRGRNPSAKPAEIGLILGTGTNQAVDLPRLGIYNIESGNFSGVTSIHTFHDQQLDQALPDPPPGVQLFEKMVSGQYLGELVRRILTDLARHTGMFQWSAVEALHTPFAFETEYLSRIAQDQSPGLSDIEALLQDWGLQSVWDERKALQTITHAIVQRSAQLSAASLVGTLQKIDPHLETEHTIAVDGSLYGGYPGYDQMVQTTLATLVGAEQAARIDFVFLKDSTSAGAAVIAATAHSALVDAQENQ